MIIILIGAPACGKGTQAELLKEKYALRHISTGDLLRAEISKNTPLGEDIAKLINNGNLVPDDMILGLLNNALKMKGKGIVLDGFPRTLTQAKLLRGIVKDQGEKIRAVVNFTLAEEEVVQRIIYRRQCRHCGNIFSVRFVKNFDGHCPKCDSTDIYQRADDTETSARHRLEIYKKETEPVKEFFKEKTYYMQTDGNRPVQEIFKDISSFIERK